MAYSKYAAMKHKVKTITSSHTITIAEIVAGTMFATDTTSGEVVYTLPSYTGLPSTGDVNAFIIGHNKGSNNVKIQCDGAETFTYGNTYFNLGSHMFEFQIGGTYDGSTAKWGLMDNLTIKASAHRDADWASSNFTGVTIVPWDSEKYNNQDELLVYTSGASARYTVKTAGTYKISYTIDLDSTGGSTWNATSWVYKNGVALENSEVRTGNYGNEDQSMTLPSQYVDLVVDDYLDLRIDQNSLTGNMVHSMFNIELVL